ncbi:phage tail protein [Aerosakkonema sp. BLCC-F183]|uniref:phage tail protein n=1 Tax=Aerosakkonema sp. BLCC-F183 TaxID=3342834 RepID=UPI0035B88EC6
MANNRTGIRTNPYMAYNFLVEIEGLITGGFTEVSGLESEIELESYQEGGANGYTHQFPRRIRYSNLVFSCGMTDNDTLWNWYQATTLGKIELKNGTIMLRDRQDKIVKHWNFKNAYPVKWIGPQFNATNAGTVALERLELIHQGINIPASKSR